MSIFDLLASHGMMMSAREIGMELRIAPRVVYRSLLPLRTRGLVTCIRGARTLLFVCRPMRNARTYYLIHAQKEFNVVFAPILKSGPVAEVVACRPARWDKRKMGMNNGDAVI